MIHQKIRFGIRGQCDLYALFRGGRHIEVELKSESGELSDDQKDWRGFCEHWGVPYLLLQAEEGETLGQIVHRWCDEISGVMRSPLAPNRDRIVRYWLESLRMDRITFDASGRSSEALSPPVAEMIRERLVAAGVDAHCVQAPPGDKFWLQLGRHDPRPA